YRPSHIHLKSSYLNQNEITTQIYFEGDSSIETDPWASNPSAENRIVQVLEDEENNFHTTFDIYLNVKANEIEESNLNEKKIFKSIFPNPVNEVSVIYLNNFNKSISIDICDVNGKIINQKKVQSNSILLREITNKKLPKGIYILRILNDNKPIESKRFIVN
ncbi:MAG: T9SS type A sorting domain-containing protein, partial [Bacteroidota bacterium]|nr:T9SS type A sorting domain-containing protein [Bacteroidota bacterium]